IEQLLEDRAALRARIEELGGQLSFLATGVEAVKNQVELVRSAALAAKEPEKTRKTLDDLTGQLAALKHLQQQQQTQLVALQLRQPGSQASPASPGESFTPPPQTQAAPSPYAA